MIKCQRKSIRLKDFDYSRNGYYFVTICTNDRKCLFGEIVDGQMRMNACGVIVKNEWLNTSKIRFNVELDQLMVMPNHIHGIIKITDHARRGVLQYAPIQQLRSPSQTIGSIIRGFKSSVTKQINILRKAQNIPIWQRNYYEHIVRDENDLHRIHEYIKNNPLNWYDDKNNPINLKNA